MQNFVSDASSTKGQRIFIASANLSCLQWHERITSIVFESAYSRFNVQLFNVSYTGHGNSTRMGTDHGVVHRHPNDCRISHILGIKVQSLGVTSDYPVTEVICYHSTFVKSTGGKVSKPTYTNVATQLQCPVCNVSHILFKCDRFIKVQPKQRLNCAKQLKLCLNCLQLFTKEQTCSKQLCRQCHKTSYSASHW